MYVWAKLFLRRNIWLTGQELIDVDQRIYQIKLENTLSAFWEKVDQSKNDCKINLRNKQPHGSHL